MKTFLDPMSTILLRAPDGEGGGSPAAAAPAPAPAAAPAPASDPAPAAAAEPPATVRTNIGEIGADIQALFDYDPFSGEPAAAPAQPLPAAPAQPQAEPAAQQPAAPQVPDPAATPAQPAAGPTQPDALAVIAQVLASQQQQLQQTQQTQQQAQQPQQPDVEIPQHGYQFNIPEPLINALASENPVERSQAVQAVMMTTARTVHQEVVRSLRAEMARAVPNLIQGQIQEHQRRQAVFNDFYGKYPQFSDPRLRPVVVQTAQQIATARGFQGWSPELRDAVGAHLTQLFAAVGGQPMAPAAAPAAALPAAPVIVPSAARPAGSAPVNHVEQEVRELLFG